MKVPNESGNYDELKVTFFPKNWPSTTFPIPMNSPATHLLTRNGN